MTSYDQMAYLKIQSLQFIFLGKWKDTQRSRAQFSNHSRLDFCFKEASRICPKEGAMLGCVTAMGLTCGSNTVGGTSGCCCGCNSELQRTGMLIAHPCPRRHKQ